MKLKKAMGPEVQDALRENAPVALFWASFAALFVELMLIRWEGSEIPVLSYFKNYPLLSAFIGLGAGCLMAGSARRFWNSSLWTLAGLALAVSFTEVLGLSHLIFPDPHLDLWDRSLEYSGWQVVWLSFRNLTPIFLILAANAWAFVGIGQAVGYWLGRGAPLTMYSADIFGSLAGTLLFALLSFFSTPPQSWLVVAAVLLALAGFHWSRKDRWYLLALVGLVSVAGLIAYRTANLNHLLRWSPYYRIEVHGELNSQAYVASVVRFQLNVNRDIHQVMVDVSDLRGSTIPRNSPQWMEWMGHRVHYDFPYYFKKAPESVLVGGAGSGNDVAGALRNGAGRVTGVEIDPEILKLGKMLHPLHPYDSDKVRRVNTDIRSFLKRSDEKFDVIVFGILDSHAALSSLSSLRLDDYVYTANGMQDAYRHLKPDGIMSISFFEGAREWIGGRLYRNIETATGKPPVSTKLMGTIFFLFGPGLDRAKALAQLKKMGLPDRGDYYEKAMVKPSTDDWPFLYANPLGQPVVYYVSLLLLVLLGAVFVVQIVRSSVPDGKFQMDWQMFFLGAGFLLLETKGIAEMSLLFGSTWIVNTFMFAGVFVMVLLANLAVSRGASRFLALAYVLLCLSLLAWFFFPRGALNALSYWPRAGVGTILVAVPLFFAGIVFATSFSKCGATDLAFGSNLIGAVVGGAMEATSIAWGIKSLTLLAMLFYIVSWLALRFSSRPEGAESRPPS